MPLAVLLLLGLVLVAPACRAASAQDAGDPPRPAAGAAAAVLDDAPATVAPRAWPHERSDVPVDDRITFGALDNGLRYAWMANPEPEHRSYLRLHVDVGSVVEEDDEQGLAHFLEHMAFNGSESFPAGTLIEWFQERGMAFGAHVNASTSFDETIYKIDLPDSDEESLREALVVLRDYAAGLLLEEQEVAREIGVVDGEERERDSPQFRVAIEALRRQFDGTRIAERIPIGVEEVRAAFTAESVRDFYERWYRPERMTLVVVGDLEVEDPGPLIEEVLGDIRAAGEPGEWPDMGAPTFAHRFYALYNEEVPVAQLTLARLRPWEHEPYTVEELVEDVPLRLARSMLNLRFDEMTRQQGTPFLFAGVGSAEAMEVLDGESLNLAAEPDRWKEALTVAEQELRRALRYGFRPSELEEVRADALLALKEAVDREPTRSSGSITNEILGSVSVERVPTRAATDRAILAPAYEAATVESCHEAFVRAWEDGITTLTCVGGLDLGEEDAEQLRAVWEESRAAEVEPLEEVETAAFAYASDPDERGAIAERRHVEDLDVHQVRFENGVLLNVKATDFKDREISVAVRIGEGDLALPPERYAVAFAANQLGALSGMGLGAHTIDDLRRLTAGRQVGVGVGTADDHAWMRGSTNAEDLLLQMELMAAGLSDPGWRDDAFQQGKQQVPLVYEWYGHRATGPLLMEFLPALHGGDARFGLPAQEEVEAVEMDAIREWIAPQLADGPVEVAVVGDLDVEAVVDAAARTFGRLPPRRAARAWDERRVVELAEALRQEHEIETDVPEATVNVYFPTTDGRDARVRRELAMLGTILDDRIREHVREELGEAYSPGAGAISDRVYPGVGFLQIRSASDPERTGEVLEACLTVADTLGSEGVDAGELSRLREPVLKRIRDQMRENSFWLGILDDCQSDPGRLDEIRRLLTDYQEMTAEGLSELAGRYLGRERASWVVVRPASVAGS